METKWILNTSRALLLLTFTGMLCACDLGQQGEQYRFVARVEGGRPVQVQYGVRYSSGAYPQYGIHRSTYSESGSVHASIPVEDAQAAGGNTLYISATVFWEKDSAAAVTTRIEGPGGNGASVLAEKTGIGFCESTFVFAGSFGTKPPPAKVICKELYRQGLMDDTIFRADEEFGRHLKDQQPDVLRGYQLWAMPVVRWMRDSRAVTRIVAFVATPWSYEMAYRMGARGEGSLAGRILMDLGVPACRIIGRVLAWAERL